VLLVGVLAWFVVGRALRPVHDVTRQLASIGSDSLHERVPVPPSADEVEELAATMNSMLDRLESATLVSRQLVSDASHELRTPIAVLRTELEVARRDPTTDWEAVSLGMLDEVERLQGLVDDLLLLARANERGMQAEPVDVVDVVTQVAARRRRVPVTVEVTGEPVVEADEVALRRAIDHVLANAARHAASEVRLTVCEVGGSLEVRIDDDGAGIAEADRERVLERFVRLDEGRARDSGGSGLGLAVANDVVTAHGGTVRIGRSASLGGASVTLTVPVKTRSLALA
jgi:signal transduction histidine kinase